MRVIAVVSGKGGVGKSTVSYACAMSLSKRNRVLVIDFDLCGPSIGVLFNHTTETIIKAEKGVVPIKYSDTLAYITIGAMIDKKAPVIWRAPKKLSLLNLFIESIDANMYDYVIIDMPPGVTDEHVFLSKTLPQTEILAVTTSQNLALQEVSNTIALFQSNGHKILGVVENMHQIECPNCSHSLSVFSKNGGRLLSEHLSIPYITHLDYIPKVSFSDLINIPGVSTIANYVIDQYSN
ncbi:hypothetical protein NEOKW01_0158 [Nematocida sp. AWRm80]|nr:hypothetical protein NEOKW01_0158 [Nematocida sp. AWRm80]